MKKGAREFFEVFRRGPEKEQPTTWWLKRPSEAAATKPEPADKAAATKPEPAEKAAAAPPGREAGAQRDRPSSAPASGISYRLGLKTSRQAGSAAAQGSVTE